MTNLSKEKFIDLHLHSIYSEGTLGIPQLIQQAKKFNLSVLSLTDHNTIAGVEEALRAGLRENVKVISGVEIYTHFNKFNLHLLGYNFDIYCSWLQKTLDKLARQRIVDIQKSLVALRKKGFVINEKKLFNTPSHYVGFGQIIAELWKTPANVKKVKKDLKTPLPSFFGIIDKYFSLGKAAFLPETNIPIKQAIDIIHHAGGLAVLAHPTQQIGWNVGVVKKLKKLGLDGIEVLSPYHNWHDIEHWQNIAKSLNLVITGGTDFHTFLPHPETALIKDQWQYFKIPYSIFEQLKPKLNKSRTFPRSIRSCGKVRDKYKKIKP